jgi:hypothetical protein
MNDYSEMWAEFCFLLSRNISLNTSERDYENQVVRAIELLGWREFKNEIERQPNIQIGRDGSLRPDLIIYNKDRRAMIVVEVKRPSENITRDNIMGQLRSYMRQMRTDIGFLIGADLRIFYDGQSNPHPDPLLLERIDFEESSKEGITFIQLFNKENFLGVKYQEYLDAKIEKVNIKKEVKTTIDKILSLETKQKIERFLRNEFPDVGDEIFSEAMEKVNIVISKKDTIEPTQIRPTITQNRPQRGRKPEASGFINKQVQSFIFLGTTHHPRYWKDLLVTVAEEMYRRHAAEFDRCLSLRGPRMSYFSTNASELKQPAHIPGSKYFAETYLNANSIVRRSRELIELFGYTADDLIVSVKES